jgi:hypothetical protein
LKQIHSGGAHFVLNDRFDVIAPEGVSFDEWEEVRMVTDGEDRH